MKELGLGANLNEQRSIRELLLFEGADFLLCRDFGRVSLDTLRRALSHHGLALWGEDVYVEEDRPQRAPRRRRRRRANQNSRPAGGRFMRSIDLGDDDNDDEEE